MMSLGWELENRSGNPTELDCFRSSLTGVYSHLGIERVAPALTHATLLFAGSYAFVGASSHHALCAFGFRSTAPHQYDEPTRAFDSFDVAGINPPSVEPPPTHPLTYSR